MDRRDDRLALRHLLGRPRQLGARGERAGRGRRRAARGRRPRRRGPAAPAAAGRRRRSSGGVPMPITSASATPSSSSRRSAYLRPPIEILSTLFFATETIAPVVALAGDQLVDEAARRVAAAGDQLGADAVAVDRGGGQRGDRVLVEVAGHHDPGPRRAERRRAARGPGGPARPRSPESRRTAPSSGPATSTASAHGLARRRRCRPAAWCPCRATSPGRGTRRPRCRAAA